MYRIFKLVTVTFDTAGSSGSEGNLPAVTQNFADELRRKIGKAQPAAAGQSEEKVAALEPLLQLDWRDMIRIGLADRRALIVFALIGPLMEQMGDRIEIYVKDSLQNGIFGITEISVTTGILIFLGVAIAVFLLFALISIAAAFLRYHNFKLYLDGRTLRSNGGLLTRHEHSMDLEKIQTLRLQQGIVQNWLRRFKLTARQAISGRKQGSSKMFTIPVVTVRQANELRPLLFAGEAGRLTQDPRSPDFKPVSRYYMRARLLFIGLLPALAFYSARTRRVWSGRVARLVVVAAGRVFFLAQLETGRLPAQRR